jgi:hypothetical protein
MANELVTSRGGKFIAILQPVAYVGSPRLDHLELNAELGNNFQFVYDEVHKIIDTQKQPWIYDFSQAFNGEDYIYIDFCHVTKTGNKIIADKLSDLLLAE